MQLLTLARNLHSTHNKCRQHKCEARNAKMSKNINNKQNEKAFSSVSASVLHSIYTCVCVCELYIKQVNGATQQEAQSNVATGRGRDPLTRLAARARTMSRTPQSRQDKGQRRAQTEVMSCVTRRWLIARKVSDTGTETEPEWTSTRAELIVTLGVSCLSACCAVLCLILESTFAIPGKNVT